MSQTLKNLIRRFINKPVDEITEEQYLALYTKLKKCRTPYLEFRELRLQLDQKHHEYLVSKRPKLIETNWIGLPDQLSKSFNGRQLKAV